MAERKPALIKAAKIFLQMFIIYSVSHEANRAGNDSIEDSINNHSVRTIVHTEDKAMVMKEIRE